MSKQLLKLSDETQYALNGLTVARSIGPALTLVEKPDPIVIAPVPAPR